MVGDPVEQSAEASRIWPEPGGLSDGANRVAFGVFEKEFEVANVIVRRCNRTSL